MAKINKFGRIFLKNLSEKYDSKITTAKALKNAVKNGTIPKKDWAAYSKLITATNANLSYDQMANDMGKGYIKKVSDARSSSMKGQKKIASPDSKPSTLDTLKGLDPSTIVSSLKSKKATLSAPTAPTKPHSKPPTDVEVFSNITKTGKGDKDEDVQQAKTLLNPEQEEALKKVTAANEQEPEVVDTGGGYDQFAGNLVNRFPDATGRIAPLRKFGRQSDSNILNMYDAGINALSARRTKGQERIASASPWVTQAANIAGGAAGGLAGSYFGKPGLGASLGTKLAGYGTQAGLGYLTTPKSRMTRIADRLISKQGIGTRARRGIGNLIGGQEAGLGNYFASRFGGDTGFMSKIGRAIGGQPTFNESLRASMTDPNLASNVRSGIEGSIALYEIAEELGLTKYAKSSLNSITRKIGLGGLADRLGLATPAAPTATGRETGRQLGGSIAEGLADRHFPERRRQLINSMGYDPGTYGEEDILEGSRGLLSPMEADYDIRRAGLQRQEQEEGILGQGQNITNRIQREREAVRSRTQDQAFDERVGKQDLMDQEAYMIAQVNAKNRSLDTTGISLGQKTQAVPVRRQGYIPAPISEQIAQGLQRAQEVTAPFVFQRKS